ncbi:MAG: prenyltransferase [Holosporales bacterium]|jgi:1,4-dihydroxy-2-naphthoate octaprenyltransferase|nr:prenyltransferase [Holosporales bacterium]
MSILLLFCGYIYSRYHYNTLCYPPFFCVGLAAIFFHLSANTISEYRDCKTGIDNIHSPDTKYRLVSKAVPENHILTIGLTSFGVAVGLGVIAAVVWQKLLFFPGAIAAVIVFSYSEWPLKLKYRAFGEVCVFLQYGPIMFSSCILALTGKISIEDMIFSIPFGLLTSLVLLANNIRDYEFEKNKTTTLTTKYGLKTSYFLLFFIVHLSFLFIPFFVYYNLLPKTGFMVFLSYPIIFLSMKKIETSEIIKIFGILQILFALLVCLSLWNGVECSY